VRPGLEQMGGKGVAQCVARNSLANTAILSRFLYQFVQVILIKMMSPQAASCGVDAQPGRREEVMPVKIKRCGGILTGKSVRQPHPGVFRSLARTASTWLICFRNGASNSSARVTRRCLPPLPLITLTC